MEKELARKIDKGIEVGNRIADALDKLVNEPLVEIKTPPPQCPHCGTINPTVKVYQHPEANGPIAEFFLAICCTTCGKDAYAISMEWNIQPNENAALMVGRQVVERIKNG